MAGRSVDALAQDLRSALRRLRRAPGFSALIVLSLALGIGANTAIFGVAREVLFEPVPYRDADRVVLVELYLRDVPTRITEQQASIIQRLARSLERVEAYANERINWRRGNSTVQLFGRVVTPGLPPAMGMIPLVGRGFALEEGSRGSEPVVMISEGLWRRELGRAQDIVGGTLVLGDVQRTVVGVSRPPVSDPNADLWVPRRLDPAGDWSPSVIAWLRPGVSLEQAGAELKALSAELTSDRFDLLEARLSRPGGPTWQGSIDQTMVIFWGASAFVLAIVCTNLANLLLARNLASQREIAIRAALGASRFGIVRLLVSESLVLGVMGGLGGVLVALWGTSALLALRPRSLSLVYPDQVALDATVIGYSLGLSLLTGLIIGVVPALRAARADPLRGVGRDDPYVQGAVSARWLFGGAVVLQTALALVLLIGAGLMANSYYQLLGVGPGFDTDNVVGMAVELDSSVHVDAGARREFFRNLAERVGSLGGVQEAAVASDAPPYSTVMMGAIEIEGRPTESLATVEVSWVHVTPEYFRVLRIPHVEGRMLADQDGRDGEVVVSRSFARTFWPQDSAVGRRFRLRREAGWRPWMHIVGVVGDVAGRGLRDDNDEIYLPYAAGRAVRSTIVARVERDPTQVFQAMKEQLWALDPDVPIDSIRTMRERLAGSIDEQPFYAMLLGAFAVIALVLAAVGVFGVTFYAAGQRSREIGIRIALGAHGSDVARLVVLQGLVPSLVGIVAGLAGALALAQIMRSLVYGVSVTDPTIYLSTALALAAVSLMAIWIPARRASRVDPILVLRSE
jgi:putative ABC transport system permease protein